MSDDLQSAESSESLTSNLPLAAVCAVIGTSYPERLDEQRQIYRNEPQVFIFSQILCVYQVFASDLLRELLAELVHGNVRLVPRGLDLDRAEFEAAREEEIDLVIVLSTWRRPSVIIDLVALGAKHLRDHILVYISQIGSQLVAQEFLIDDVLRDLIVPECHRDK